MSDSFLLNYQKKLSIIRHGWSMLTHLPCMVSLISRQTKGETNQKYIKRKVETIKSIAKEKLKQVCKSKECFSLEKRSFQVRPGFLVYHRSHCNHLVCLLLCYCLQVNHKTPLKYFYLTSNSYRCYRYDIFVI